MQWSGVRADEQFGSGDRGGAFGHAQLTGEIAGAGMVDAFSAATDHNRSQACFGKLCGDLLGQRRRQRLLWPASARMDDRVGFVEPVRAPKFLPTCGRVRCEVHFRRLAASFGNPRLDRIVVGQGEAVVMVGDALQAIRQHHQPIVVAVAQRLGDGVVFGPEHLVSWEFGRRQHRVNDLKLFEDPGVALFGQYLDVRIGVTLAQGAQHRRCQHTIAEGA